MPKRRRVLLVDRNFQLRFSFYVCSWIFGLSLIYPMIIYTIFEWIIRYAESHLSGESLVFLKNIKGEFLWNLVLLQTSFMGLTFLISLYLSHKIAGPVYKLRQFLERVKNGQLDTPLSFRKSDHFRAVATDFNEMLDAIRGRMDKNIETVSTAIARIENAMARIPADSRPQLEEALTELRKVRERSSI